ncbi:MAG: MgtC/SapB family protein [Thermodesulfovibrionales bacterium]|nr:MgtC/SapB family protein [Thermodesulfovibrionales bacterium]
MEDFLKLFIAAILGGLIGIERQISGQSAGFRTQLLVCLGSCLFTILSIHAYETYGKSADPGRIAAQVIVGIGFIGAGAILRFGKSYIRGLTTAASLWIVSAIGMSVGFGEYSISGFATLISIVSLLTLRNIENILPINRYIDITIKMRDSEKLKFGKIISGYDLKILESKFRFVKDQNIVEEQVTIKYKEPEQLEKFLETLKKTPGLLELHIS